MTSVIVVIGPAPAPSGPKRDALAVVIDAILDRRGPITASDLVAMTGWDVETAIRYLETFADSGRLRRVSEPEYLRGVARGVRPRQYRLGPASIHQARAIVAFEDDSQARSSRRIRPEE